MPKFSTPETYYSTIGPALPPYAVEEREVEEIYIRNAFSNACSQFGGQYTREQIARDVVGGFDLKFAAIRDRVTEKAILCLSTPGPQHVDVFLRGGQRHFESEDSAFFIGAGKISNYKFDWDSLSCRMAPDINRDHPEGRVEEEKAQILAAYKTWLERSVQELLK